MKTLLSFLAIIIATSFCSCKPSETTFRLTNSGDTVLAFKTQKSNPTTLLVKITGSSSEDFYIDNVGLHIGIPKGVVDTLLRFDHYTSDVSINFKNPKKGKNNLTFVCQVP